MESANTFNFIDGYNLNFAELKLRLSRMGLEKEHITDFQYIANLYNDIMSSNDNRFLSKIKNFLEDDKKRIDFSDLLCKKRTRATINEKKVTNGLIHPNRREVDSSNIEKNE